MAKTDVTPISFTEKFWFSDEAWIKMGLMKRDGKSKKNQIKINTFLKFQI